MPTTLDGRWSPDDSDDWDLTTDLAAMQVSNMTATNNAITTASRYRTMTNAQRLALSGASLSEGLLVYTTDTRLNHLYTQGAWQSETAWTTLTLAAGQGYTQGNLPLQYRRYLNRVELRGTVYRTTVPAGQTVATLPSFVPNPYGQVRFMTRTDANQQVIIANNGAISMTASSAISSGAGYVFDGVGYGL